MKKILTISLTVVGMAFLFVGCRGDRNNGVVAPLNPANSPASVQTPMRDDDVNDTNDIYDTNGVDNNTNNVGDDLRNDVNEGTENAGNAVRNGTNAAGDAIKNGVDAVERGVDRITE